MKRKSKFIKVISLITAFAFFFSSLTPPAFARSGNYGTTTTLESMGAGAISGVGIAVGCLINPVWGCVSSIVSDGVGTILYFAMYDTYGETMIEVGKVKITKGQFWSMVAGCAASLVGGIVSGLIEGGADVGTEVGTQAGTEALAGTAADTGTQVLTQAGTQTATSVGTQVVVQTTTSVVANTIIGQIIQAIKKAVMDALKAVWNALVWFFNNVIKPVCNAIKKAAVWVYKNILKPIWDTPIQKVKQIIRNFSQYSDETVGGIFRLSAVGANPYIRFGQEMLTSPVNGLIHALSYFALDVISGTVRLFVSEYVKQNLEEGIYTKKGKKIIGPVDETVAQIVGDMVGNYAAAFVQNTLAPMIARAEGGKLDNQGAYLSDGQSDVAYGIDKKGKKKGVSGGELAACEAFVADLLDDGALTKDAVYEVNRNGKIIYVSANDIDVNNEAIIGIKTYLNGIIAVAAAQQIGNGVVKGSITLNEVLNDASLKEAILKGQIKKEEVYKISTSNGTISEITGEELLKSSVVKQYQSYVEQAAQLAQIVNVANISNDLSADTEVTLGGVKTTIGEVYSKVEEDIRLGKIDPNGAYELIGSDGSKVKVSVQELIASGVVEQVKQYMYLDVQGKLDALQVVNPDAAYREKVTIATVAANLDKLQNLKPNDVVEITLTTTGQKVLLKGSDITAEMLESAKAYKTGMAVAAGQLQEGVKSIGQYGVLALGDPNQTITLKLTRAGQDKAELVTLTIDELVNSSLLGQISSNPDKPYSIKAADGTIYQLAPNDVNDQVINGLKVYEGAISNQVYQNVFAHTGGLMYTLDGRDINTLKNRLGLRSGFEAMRTMGLTPIIATATRVALLEVMNYETYYGNTDYKKMFMNKAKMAVANVGANITSEAFTNWDWFQGRVIMGDKGTEVYKTRFNKDTGKTEFVPVKKHGKELTVFVIDPVTGEISEEKVYKTKKVYNNPFQTRGSLGYWRNLGAKSVENVFFAASEIGWGYYCKEKEITPTAVNELVHLGASSLIAGTVDAIFRQNKQGNQDLKSAYGSDTTFVGGVVGDASQQFYEAIVDSVLLPVNYRASGTGPNAFMNQWGVRDKFTQHISVISQGGTVIDADNMRIASNLSYRADMNLAESLSASVNNWAFMPDNFDNYAVFMNNSIYDYTTNSQVISPEISNMPDVMNALEQRAIEAETNGDLETARNIRDRLKFAVTDYIDNSYYLSRAGVSQGQVVFRNLYRGSVGGPNDFDLADTNILSNSTIKNSITANTKLTDLPQEDKLRLVEEIKENFKWIYEGAKGPDGEAPSVDRLLGVVDSLKKGVDFYHSSTPMLAEYTTVDRFGRMLNTYYYSGERLSLDSNDWQGVQLDRVSTHYYGPFGHALSVTRDYSDARPSYTPPASKPDNAGIEVQTNKDIVSAINTSGLRSYTESAEAADKKLDEFKNKLPEAQRGLLVEGPNGDLYAQVEEGISKDGELKQTAWFFSKTWLPSETRDGGRQWLITDESTGASLVDLNPQLLSRYGDRLYYKDAKGRSYVRSNTEEGQAVYKNEGTGERFEGDASQLKPYIRGNVKPNVDHIPLQSGEHLRVFDGEYVPLPRLEPISVTGFKLPEPDLSLRGPSNRAAGTLAGGAPSTSYSLTLYEGSKGYSPYIGPSHRVDAQNVVSPGSSYSGVRVSEYQRFKGVTAPGTQAFSDWIPLPKWSIDIQEQVNDGKMQGFKRLSSYNYVEDEIRQGIREFVKDQDQKAADALSPSGNPDDQDAFVIGNALQSMQLHYISGKTFVSGGPESSDHYGAFRTTFTEELGEDGSSVDRTFIGADPIFKKTEFNSKKVVTSGINPSDLNTYARGHIGQLIDPVKQPIKNDLIANNVEPVDNKKLIEVNNTIYSINNSLSSSPQSAREATMELILQKQAQDIVKNNDIKQEEAPENFDPVMHGPLRDPGNRLNWMNEPDNTVPVNNPKTTDADINSNPVLIINPVKEFPDENLPTAALPLAKPVKNDPQDANLNIPSPTTSIDNLAAIEENRSQNTQLAKLEQVVADKSAFTPINNTELEKKVRYSTQTFREEAQETLISACRNGSITESNYQDVIKTLREVNKEMGGVDYFLVTNSAKIAGNPNWLSTFKDDLLSMPQDVDDDEDIDIVPVVTYTQASLLNDLRQLGKPANTPQVSASQNQISGFTPINNPDLERKVMSKTYILTEGAQNILVGACRNGSITEDNYEQVISNLVKLDKLLTSDESNESGGVFTFIERNPAKILNNPNWLSTLEDDLAITRPIPLRTINQLPNPTPDLNKIIAPVTAVPTGKKKIK